MTSAVSVDAAFAEDFVKQARQVVAKCTASRTIESWVCSACKAVNKTSAESCVECGAKRKPVWKDPMGKSSKFTVYVIVVTIGDKSWTVEKRFSDFYDLRTQLSNYFRKLPALPPKTWMPSYDEDLIKERISQLTTFLSQISQLSGVCCTRSYRTFLKLDANGVSTSHLPRLLGSVSYNNEYGVSAFVHSEAKRLLVMSLEEVGAINILDKKLLNIRMPWEKETPQIPLGYVVVLRKQPNDNKWQQTFDLSFLSQISCIIEAQPNTILASKESGEVVVLSLSDDLNSVSLASTLPCEHTDRVTGMIYNEKRNHVYTCSRDKTLQVWDFEAQTLQKITCGPAWLTDMAFDDSEGRVLISTYAKTILIYDVISAGPPTLLHTLEGHQGSVRCVTYDSSIRYAFSGGFDSAGQVWLIEPGKDVRRSRSQGILQGGPKQKIKSILFIKSLLLVVTGYEAGSAAVWDTQGTLLVLLPGHKKPVTTLQWSAPRKLLLTGSEDGTIRFWQFPATGAIRPNQVKEEAREEVKEQDIVQEEMKEDLR